MNMRYMMSQETPSQAESGSASARGFEIIRRSLQSSSTSPGSDSESSSSEEIGSNRLQQEVPTGKTKESYKRHIEKNDRRRTVVVFDKVHVVAGIRVHGAGHLTEVPVVVVDQMDRCRWTDVATLLYL